MDIPCSHLSALLVFFLLQKPTWVTKVEVVQCHINLKSSVLCHVTGCQEGVICAPWTFPLTHGWKLHGLNANTSETL